MNERDDLDRDWLDEALRADAREHRERYVADDGFTARVVASLPAAPTLPAWRRPALAGLWTLAAVGMCWAIQAPTTDFANVLSYLVSRQPVSFANLIGGVCALGLAAWAAALYALRSSD